MCQQKLNIVKKIRTKFYLLIFLAGFSFFLGTAGHETFKDDGTGPGLQHFQDQAFQVEALRQGEKGRVVPGGAPALHHPGLAVGLGGSLPDYFEKIRLAEVIGARAGDQRPAGRSAERRGG